MQENLTHHEYNAKSNNKIPSRKYANTVNNVMELLSLYNNVWGYKDISKEIETMETFSYRYNQYTVKKCILVVKYIKGR